MAEPVIFLSFANQADNPLPQLSEEYQIVYETLQQLPKSEAFTLHRDVFTSGTSLTSMLRTFDDRVSVFHFAGHASGAQLFLTDHPIEGGGLVQLLALQAHLRLVFLNGCHTSGFIQRLQAVGIKAVIATSRAVDDVVAVELAKEFYACLAKGFSIGRAFDFAKATLESTGKTTAGKIASRGIRLPSQSTSDFPWGLYYTDEKAIQWKITDAINDLNPVPRLFWPRLIVLILLVFGFFSWGNLHFGTENIALYLTVGPLAIIAIATTLLKLFGESYPQVMTQVGKPLFGIANFLLRPVMLILLFVCVLGLFLTFTSVRIDHPGAGPLSARVMNNDVPVRQWQTGSSNPDLTRVHTFSAPLSRHHMLSVNGYENRDIRYGLFGTVLIPLDSLSAYPVVYVRVPLRLIMVLRQLKLYIQDNGKAYLDGQTFSDTSASVLLGNDRALLTQKTIEGWQNDIADVLRQDFPDADEGTVTAYGQKVLGLWTRPMTIPGHPLHAGDTLVFVLRQENSIAALKTIVVKNSAINHVLLD